MPYVLCSVYDNKLPRGYSWGPPPLSMQSLINGGGVRSASPDLCQELREKIGYNYYSMSVWVEKEDRYKFYMEIGV